MKQECSVHKIEHHQSIIKLLKWMKTMGYRSNKLIAPAIFSGCGRGMMAKCDIGENSCIISIPRCLLITTAVVNRSWFGSILRKNSCQLTSREVLSLFLVCEKHRGLDSPWHPYLETLPRNYTLPINWKQIPIDLPERTKTVFLNQIEGIKLSYNRVQNFIDILERCRPNMKGVVTIENFVWAWCTVQTRGVYFKEENPMDENDKYALAPFLDFFNHSPSADVSAKFCQETDCYQIISHQSHSKSSQVFINYGAHDNLHLILNYGFYVLKNTQSSVQFKLDEVCDVLNEMELGNNLEKKFELLEENKLFKAVACRYDEVSWNFIVCARILVCGYKELQQWSRALNGTISSKNEELMNNLIEKCISKRLSENLKCNLPSEYDDNNFSLILIEEERNILNSCKLKY